MTMKFCNVKVESPFFLAPMAAFTNLPFRLLCKKAGAGMVFTEMVTAAGISRKPEISEKLQELKTCREEKPVAVQLFASKPEEFAKAASIVEKDFEILNVNAGCPATKETTIGAGAALLRKPELIGKIVEAMKEIAEKPVTVKIRLGWQKDDSVKICKIIEKAGADAIIVHARLAGQGYSGKADWSAVKFLVKNSGIPIVYNGDINSENAFELLEKTGCGFGMIGRAAISNPFVFKEIDALKNGKDWKAGRKERINAFFEYEGLCKKFGILDFADLKLKAMQFCKGMEGARKAREKITQAKNSEEIERAMEEIEK